MKEYICIIGANSAIAKVFIKKIENFNLILLDKDEINTKHEFIRIDALDLNSIIDAKNKLLTYNLRDKVSSFLYFSSLARKSGKVIRDLKASRGKYKDYADSKINAMRGLCSISNRSLYC